MAAWLTWRWALVPILAVALYTDWRWRKLPNWLTVPACVAGCLVSLAAAAWLGEPAGGPLAGLLDALGGTLVGFGVSFAIYAVGQLVFGAQAFGAGDVKLLAAIGAWLGTALMWQALLHTAWWGGVVALLWALWHGRLRTLVDRIAAQGLAALTYGPSAVKPPTSSVVPPFPYGVAIALGALTALVFAR